MKKKIIRIGFYFLIMILIIGALNLQVVSSRKSIINNTNIPVIESTNELRNIMLTGYWNPTGQMIAQFSDDSYLNPDGWKGGNWEDWGYNIYSFFPKPGTYNGTFEVDYQNTWEDFWGITEEINPIAIISFGAGAGPWEIEYNARNLDNWVPDNVPPYQPTPCPPDDTKPAGYIRHSTLPVQAIADAVNDQTTVNAWVDWNGNPGAYLCEYMAYLGMWYQDIHNTTNETYPCLSSGFIHVTAGLPLEDAIEATEITLREVIKSLLNPNSPPNTPTIDGPITGKAGVKYIYTFNSEDIDDDDVYYYIKWGDGHTEVWTGPYASGVDFDIEHTYTRPGTFTIEAKAKDTKGEESNWGELTVTMPRDKEISSSPLMRFLQRYPLLNLLYQWFGQK
ncbi:hypothetical protein AYK24_01955 [Thermoplasmatales archaeon SG8-52-4]|nr:MAG: hypothetical protein AYK24_01955 [Thermoplasmatales archaeon SG8-52-4]